MRLPFAVFESGAAIPADYYIPLLARTDKPLAVAEGGYISEPVATFPGSPQDQVDYLEAIHDQLGDRLVFWVYLTLSDFDLDSYMRWFRQHGARGDVSGLALFASTGLRELDGTPKPGLAVWDSFREGR